MADKGIIFSAPMVRALNDGRKTQTRRLAKPRKGLTLDDLIEHGETRDKGDFIEHWATREQLAPPAYAPGDRLYVRENWTVDPNERESDGSIWGKYQATPESPQVSFSPPPEWKVPRNALNGGWIPCIHMPRWASRLWLAVSEVRVQRLQEISEADAIAEGIKKEWVIVGANCNGGRHGEDWDWRYWHGAGEDPDEGFDSAVDAYAALWNSLHTEPGTRWQDNPWIVAVSFTVNKGNIDAA